MLHGIFLDRKGYLYEIFLFSGSNSLPFNSFLPYWNPEFAYANCFQSDRSIHAPVFWLINSSWTLASNSIQQHSSICTFLSFFDHCSDKALYLWTEAPRVFVALLSFLTKAPSKKVRFRPKSCSNCGSKTVAAREVEEKKVAAAGKGNKAVQINNSEKVQKKWPCALCQVTTTCKKNLDSY
ncbi:hypothetical protein RHMOL_Rhmol08G0237300 [Rhododendron molle]|nr:hypothetical protein RHMOL_Rhmol08G0237300 [Rhododendron molle]